jgi:N-acetylneuraminic acid mutarotase
MWNVVQRAALGGALASVLLIAAGAAQTREGWTMRAPLPQAMTEIVGVVAANKLTVIGGLDQGHALGTVQEYDDGADRWIVKKPMPVPAHHIMVAALGARIFVFGGFVPSGQDDGWMPIDRAWEYDPQGDTWKALAPMPTRRGAGAAVELGGRIYVIGGSAAPPHHGGPITEATVLPSVGTLEEYDPASGAWRTLQPMPSARNHFTAAAVDGKLYVIGGRIGDVNVTRSSNTDVVEAYDPAADAWTLRARMPTARSGTAGGAHAGRVYVVGGEYQNDEVMMAFRAVEAYDAASNSWSVMPRMLSPRHGLAGAVLGTRLHAVGGDFQSAGVPDVHPHLATHEVFDLER